MDVIMHAIESVLGIFLMIVLGFFLARRGYVDDKGAALLAWLVIKVAMPCIVLVNITENFNSSTLQNLFYGLGLPAVSMVTSYYIGRLFCSLLKVPKGRRQIFITMFYITNCLFLGLPINIELFGEQSGIYVFEYYIANTIALWTVGVYQVAAEGSEEKVKFDLTATVKSIVCSPLLGVFLAVILVMLDINLPNIFKSPLKYTGSLTTPLSMLFIGLALNRVKLSELAVIDREMVFAYIGRFIVGPLTLLAAHPFIPVSELSFKVTVIQSVMPMAPIMPALAAAYGLDVKYAAIMASVSTLLFIVVIPVYMWLLHIYFGG